MESVKDLLKSADREELSALLPKVVRLGAVAGISSLEKLARLELLGYWNTNTALTEDVMVPEYRTVGGRWLDIYRRQLLISDPGLKFINEYRLRHGVVELENYLDGSGPLMIQDAASSELIKRHLDVDVTHFEFSRVSVSEVLVAVRARLVDQLLPHAELKPPASTGLPREDEILQLKPNFYGVGVDLRALFRKLFRGRHETS